MKTEGFWVATDGYSSLSKALCNMDIIHLATFVAFALFNWKLQTEEQSRRCVSFQETHV